MPIDIQLLKSQINGLVADSSSTSHSDLKQKYKYLYQKSPTLFEFVCKNVTLANFNHSRFNDNIQLYLENLEKVQTLKMTQHDASVIVGERLAGQFLPKVD
ncbi:hypothetical protein EB118_03490 [bacterium]|nr:hypothetical protein [bacterium]NDC94043.1 hypothetical protein [bacterium]NDD82729.1 hypothetical protein [bacterium]NDG29149.1 hypothetical protein [bacterium]